MISVTPDGNVKISFGDTGELNLRFSGDVPPDGTQCLVTLKRTPAFPKPLWEKRLSVAEGQVQVRLESADTAFSPGSYYWDVRLLWEGEVITPMLPRKFEILGVVGNV